MDAVARAKTNVPGSERLLGMSWAHFLNDGAANYLPGILPAILLSLHLPLTMAGVLVAALFVGQMSQPFMGWIADRLGGRGLIITGLLASSLGGGLLGMAHATWILMLLLLLIGLGSSLFHPQALAAARSMAAARQGVLISAFLVGGELGRGVWPTAASVISTNLGLESLWILAVPALITIPFLLRWAPKLPARPRAGSADPLAGTPRPDGAPHRLHERTCLRDVRAGDVHPDHVARARRGAGERRVDHHDHPRRRRHRQPQRWPSGRPAGPPPRTAGVRRSRPRPSRSRSRMSAVSGFGLVAALLGIVMFLSASSTILIGQDIFRENPSMGSGVALGLANGIGAALVGGVGFLVNESDVVTVFWVLAGVVLLVGAACPGVAAVVDAPADVVSGLGGRFSRPP